MCRRTTCSRCGLAGWAGCGAHVEQVLAGVPDSARCRCEPVSLVARLKALLGR